MSEIISRGKDMVAPGKAKKILVESTMIAGLVTNAVPFIQGEVAHAEANAGIVAASVTTDYKNAAKATDLALQQIFPQAESMIDQISEKSKIHRAGDLAVDKAEAMFVVQFAANNNYKRAKEIITFIEDTKVKKRAEKAMALAKKVKNGDYSKVMSHWGYFYDEATKAKKLFESNAAK